MWLLPWVVASWKFDNYCCFTDIYHLAIVNFRTARLSTACVSLYALSSELNSWKGSFIMEITPVICPPQLICSVISPPLPIFQCHHSCGFGFLAFQNQPEMGNCQDLCTHRVYSVGGSQDSHQVVGPSPLLLCCNYGPCHQCWLKSRLDWCELSQGIKRGGGGGPHTKAHTASRRQQSLLIHRLIWFLGCTGRHWCVAYQDLIAWH